MFFCLILLSEETGKLINQTWIIFKSHIFSCFLISVKIFFIQSWFLMTLGLNMPIKVVLSLRKRSRIFFLELNEFVRYIYCMRILLIDWYVFYVDLAILRFSSNLTLVCLNVNAFFFLHLVNIFPFFNCIPDVALVLFPSKTKQNLDSCVSIVFFSQVLFEKSPSLFYNKK